MKWDINIILRYCNIEENNENFQWSLAKGSNIKYRYVQMKLYTLISEIKEIIEMRYKYNFEIL